MARMLGSTGTDHGGRRMPLVADVSSPGATTSERRDSSNQPIVPGRARVLGGHRRIGDGCRRNMQRIIRRGRIEGALPSRQRLFDGGEPECEGAKRD